MNIPLNIDLQQILLHLLNFAILSLGLYLLLYKPIKNFMDKREDYYKNIREQAEATLKQAEGIKESYEKRLKDVEKEMEEHKAKAIQEAVNDADEILNSARKEAERIISEAQNTARMEKEKIVEEAKKDIAIMVVETTEKLLAQSDKEAFDQFLNTLAKDENHVD